VPRLIFAGKEAVYKAIHPLDGTPLDFPTSRAGSRRKRRR